MMPVTQTRLRLMFGAASMSVMVTFVHAQFYPTKPIRVVIPFSAGGATDIPGRILVEKLSEALRYQVIVDNRPGAGSTIGASLVAKAPPDGYTLLITATTHVIGAHLYKELPYHPVNDFTPVMQIGVAPSVLVVHPSLPEVENRFLASGNDVVATNPERFGALLRSDFETWGKVVKQSRASLN